jgi:hypothetical protein
VEEEKVQQKRALEDEDTLKLIEQLKEMEMIRNYSGYDY